MQRVLSLGPRVGFALLVGALVAFEVLFVAELRQGAASLARERGLREGRATEALEAALVAQLDVAEARVEALETLPLLEEDGLLWVRDGVQLLPRVADVAQRTPELERRLEVAPTEPAEVLRLWPFLPRKTAAAWCVQVQRLDPKNRGFVEACQRGLQGRVVPVEAGEAPSLQGAWLVVRRGADVRGAEVKLDEVVARVEAQLLQRATLEGGDSVAVVERRPLPGLRLISPRLDAAEVALIRAWTWKTVLLALTALLGLSVVLLARLAERRRAETVALQREFISTVSHELRTPLAAIRVMAETLERKLPGDGPAKDYPHRLVAAADGLTFLVDNILSFNRLESGRLEPKREVLPLATLEAWLREDAQLAVDTEVEVRCSELTFAVNVDPELMRVLVLNLLRNAWKYGARRPVVFEVRAQLAGDGVVVSFSDNGPGIPLDARERVFEAFHRLPTARKTGGSGLGLALARRIAELHGGTLRICASSDQGSTFELRLPRAG